MIVTAIYFLCLFVVLWLYKKKDLQQFLLQIKKNTSIVNLASAKCVF